MRKNYILKKISWHTKDWKERREAIIKDKCEQCGSTDTLTLQHFSHPRNYKEIQRSTFQHYYEKFLDENASNLKSLISKDDILNYIKNAPHEIKMVCPVCSGNFYTRRKAPIHVCNRCKHEFDEPISKEIPEYVDDLILTEEEKLEIADLKKSSVKFYSDLYPSIIGIMVGNKYLFEIEKMAMLNYLDENIEYLSFKDTKTFCKKCAFNYDKMGRDLCPKCRVNYKQIRYETCVDCLPEGEQKDRIRERQTECKEMKEYFKYLG
jgi:uncharacterized paraquat-inducible protein A